MSKIINKLKERLVKKEEWIAYDDPALREDYVDGYRTAVEEEILFLKECLSILEE